jgi:hypothetical protein
MYQTNSNILSNINLNFVYVGAYTVTLLVSKIQDNILALYRVTSSNFVNRLISPNILISITERKISHLHQGEFVFVIIRQGD